MLAVDVKNIKKTFTSKQDTVEAVKDVSFQVKQGEIFGLLGPNGAGKSTTILMLTTLLSITDGKASILGIDVETQEKQVREKIGVALQDTGIDNLLTSKELFFTTCRLWGYNKSDSEKRTEELLELVGLTEAADRRVKTYSGGMKRRLDLGLSLVHSPEILFLDEPTTGLDPNQLVEIRNVIKNVGKDKTVFLSTHIMQEVEALCDRVLIINNGKILVDNKLEKLISQQKEQLLEVEFDKAIAVALLSEMPHLVSYKNSDGFIWELNFATDEDMRSIVFDFAQTNGYKTLQLNQKNKNLEHLFREITSEKKSN